MEDEGREIRALVVDDDESIRLFLSSVLTEEGCRVLTASDGVEAVALLKAEPVDLLITDYNMQRMNGLDLIWWSKAHFPEVPAVLMTGDDDPGLAGAAQACGALRVCLKPFPIGELLLLLRGIRSATMITPLATGSPSVRA